MKKKTISAVIIHTSGVMQFVDLEDDYKSIQHAVGGTFDAVSSESGETTFWLHDEGKIIGMEVNVLATKLLWQLNPAFARRDFLVGPVLITGGADENGDTLSLSNEARAAIG